jgi:hypothetical protein
MTSYSLTFLTVQCYSDTTVVRTVTVAEDARGEKALVKTHVSNGQTRFLQFHHTPDTIAARVKIINLQASKKK